MALFNNENDPGVYTPSAREIYYNQINPQASSLTSNIQFRVQSNEVQQIVPLQSYFTIELEIDDVNFPNPTGTVPQVYDNSTAVAPNVSGTVVDAANVTAAGGVKLATSGGVVPGNATNFLDEHLNEYFHHNFFSRVNVSMNGVRVSSLDQPTAYLHAYCDAVCNPTSSETSEDVFNKAPMTLQTGQTKKKKVTLCYRPHMSFFDLPYAVVAGDFVVQFVPKDSSEFAAQTFSVPNLAHAPVGASSMGGSYMTYDACVNSMSTGNFATNIGESANNTLQFVGGYPDAQTSAGGAGGFPNMEALPLSFPHPTSQNKPRAKYTGHNTMLDTAINTALEAGQVTINVDVGGTPTPTNFGTLGFSSDDQIATAKTMNPIFNITGMQFFCAFATPQVPMPLPPLLRHQLSTPNIQFVPLEASQSVNQTLTIPSSTYYIQVYAFDNASSFRRARGPLRFDQSAISEITLRIAGGTYPSLPYTNLDSVHSTDLTRAYTDSISSRMRLDKDSAYPKTLREWVQKPIISHQIYRAQNNTDQTLQIQLKRSNYFESTMRQHQLCVVCYSHEVLGLSYDQNQLVRVDVQSVL